MFDNTVLKYAQYPQQIFLTLRRPLGFGDFQKKKT